MTFTGFRTNANKQWYKRYHKIKSLENRGIFLKGTTKTIISQKGGLLNFLGPLMKVGLLMRNVFIPSTKFILIPLRITFLGWKY